MIGILMGTITAAAILVAGVLCFNAGLNALDICAREVSDKPRPKAEPTEEQRKIAEGLSNMLNYGNRHSKQKCPAFLLIKNEELRMKNYGGNTLCFF